MLSSVVKGALCGAKVYTLSYKLSYIWLYKCLWELWFVFSNLLKFRNVTEWLALVHEMVLIIKWDLLETLNPMSRWHYFLNRDKLSLALRFSFLSHFGIQRHILNVRVGCYKVLLSTFRCCFWCLSFFVVHHERFWLKYIVVLSL